MNETLQVRNRRRIFPRRCRYQSRHRDAAASDSCQSLKDALGDRVSGEMLQSQIEVSTSPHTDMNTASAELKHLRQTAAQIAAEHGLAILAAGTHPTAHVGSGAAIARRTL